MIGLHRKREANCGSRESAGHRQIERARNEDIAHPQRRRFLVMHAPATIFGEALEHCTNLEVHPIWAPAKRKMQAQPLPQTRGDGRPIHREQ
ncbi:hypothetical protein M4951_11450 [Blastopirellula sp. J2-11]|uniref:hypothetical protein n=1 Tax=Blastopirellula sp. J2-11 TaxID=2943192 RepID=UPI0021C742AD|nr:hypothetical protein [Blastopirellula sp. J2-11]UUO08906.1 hypothetical protein M4951_11450 [Blastopirellula sp. J2-11]